MKCVRVYVLLLYFNTGFRVEDDDLNPLIRHMDGTIDSVFGMPIQLTLRVMEKALSEAGVPVRPPATIFACSSRSRSMDVMAGSQDTVEDDADADAVHDQDGGGDDDKYDDDDGVEKALFKGGDQEEEEENEAYAKPPTFAKQSLLFGSLL